MACWCAWCSQPPTRPEPSFAFGVLSTGFTPSPGDVTENTMQKLLILAAIAASLSVAACNTVEGAGKDVSSAGDAVSSTAREVKN